MQNRWIALLKLFGKLLKCKPQMQNPWRCSYVEIISTKLKGGGAGEDDGDGEEEEEMPALVYVAREKRRSCPHHFKAGALNALLRVSGVVSNASYLLVLDCDMACNSRASAMEAMCFLLDRRRSRNSNLAFVQFPQIFHNLSDKDIYANELRYIFGTRWFGLDGVRGPLLSGTGFYVRRDALYGATPPTADDGDDDLSTGFGHSDRLLEASLRGGVCLAAEPESLAAAASCAYEAGTAWGDGAGFMYQSVVEDYLTGYQRFFSRGWTSAYCYPYPARRPAFLGSVPTNLNDVLVQNKRWMSGMLAVGISSRHSPLACRPLLRASLLQAMAYAYFGFAALYAVPVLCYATLPQLCFLRGVPLFTPCPAAAAFASSLLQHLVEVSVCAATTTRRRRSALRTWWSEQRFWVLNALTAQLLGCVSAAQELLGARALDFHLTTKAAAHGRLYEDGVFDFTGCSTLLLPATTLSVLNAAAIVVGTCKSGGFPRGHLLPQLFLMCYGAALSYPLLEGMFLRQDPARVPPRITALSVALAAVLLAVFG